MATSSVSTVGSLSSAGLRRLNVQPPPPPTYVPPPLPPPGMAPPPGMGLPPTPKKSPTWCFVVGCGCLVLLVLLGVAGYYGYHYLSPKVIEGAKAIKLDEPQKPAGPSQAAAEAAALSEVPGTTQIVSHSDDWKAAVIKVTPDGEKPDQAIPVTLTWDEEAKDYTGRVKTGSDVRPDAINPDNLDKPLLGDDKQ